MISTICIAITGHTPSASVVGLIIALGVIAAVLVAVGVWWIVREAIGSWWGWRARIDRSGRATRE